MSAVYLVCLVVGALLSVILAVLGFTHDFSALPHHADATTSTDHGPAGGRMDLVGHPMVWALSWLSPITLGGFLLLFGGAGFLLGGSAFVLPAAIAAGLLGALAIRSLMQSFVRASSPGLAATSEGAIGTITTAIAVDGTGEVTLLIEGTHRTIICRAENSKLPIPRGTQVVVTRREGGYAWVEPLDTLETLPG